MEWENNPKLVVGFSAIGLVALVGLFFYWSPFGILGSVALLGGFALFLLVGGMLEETKF